VDRSEKLIEYGDSWLSRNAFRCSLLCSVVEVEHWMGEGGDDPTELN